MNEVEAQRGPALWDAANQQVVRPDHSGPGDPPSGSGGSTSPVAPQQLSGLDAMSKDELLAEAQRLGVSPANNAMTKDELRAGIDAKLEEAPA